MLRAVPRYPRASVLAVVAAAALAGGCSSKGAASTTGTSTTTTTSTGSGVTPGYSAKFRATLANPAAPADAEGERIYYEETFGTEVLGDWPPADFMVHLWKSDVATWGEQFENYGWLVDPGDDLPVGLKRGSTDPTKIHETCAACHVTKLDDGRIWSGMPSLHLDYAAFGVAVSDAWAKAGNPPILDPKSVAKHNGVLQRGASNADSTDDPHVVPADFPLYVNLAQRKNLGYTGAGRDTRSQVWLSVFTFGAGDSLPFPGPTVDTMVAYMNTLVTPKPLSVPDAAAVTRGAKVFDTNRCGSCHHVDDLGSDGVTQWVSGPELFPGDDPMHPEGTIATDYNFYGLSDQSAVGDGGGPGPGLIKLIQFILSNQLHVGQTDGYAVTDLHALFTSAPYLHNGSVPTLEDLFSPPASRPVTFQREGRTVDTTKDGMSNVGHTFGTTLSASDKSDLLAYLRSL